eukprot:g1029.t1
MARIDHLVSGQIDTDDGNLSSHKKFEVEEEEASNPRPNFYMTATMVRSGDFHGNLRGTLVDYSLLCAEALSRGGGASYASNLLMFGGGHRASRAYVGIDALLADPSVSLGAVFSHILTTQGSLSCAMGFVEEVVVEAVPAITVSFPLIGHCQLKCLVRKAFQAGYLFLFGLEVGALFMTLKSGGVAVLPLFLLRKLLQWLLCWLLNLLGRKLGRAVTQGLQRLVTQVKVRLCVGEAEWPQLDRCASQLLQDAQRELESSLDRPAGVTAPAQSTQPIVQSPKVKSPAGPRQQQHVHGAHGYVAVGECSICHDAAPRVAFLCPPPHSGPRRQAGQRGAKRSNQEPGFAHLFCDQCVADLFSRRRRGHSPKCPVCRQPVLQVAPLAEKRPGGCPDKFCLFTGPCLGCDEHTACVLTVYTSEGKTAGKKVKGQVTVKSDYCLDCCNPKFPNFLLVSNFDNPVQAAAVVQNGSARLPGAGTTSNDSSSAEQDEHSPSSLDASLEIETLDSPLEQEVNDAFQLSPSASALLGDALDRPRPPRGAPAELEGYDFCIVHEAPRADY